MKNITFDELFNYIRENSCGDYNLYSYLKGFVLNMIDNSLYSAVFSWSENELFTIEISDSSTLEDMTFDVLKWNNFCLRNFDDGNMLTRD